MNSRASEPDFKRPATTDELLSHADWVRRLSRALLSDPNAAEDVAQDAWVAALKRPPTAGAGMRAWWARVVRSTASNHRRSELRRTDREQRVASERAEATDPQVESTLEAHRRLAAAIEALDEPLRAVIVAHFFHGASSREIAEREGVADSTIRTRLQKALEKLRRELDLRAGGDRKAWVGLLAPLAKLEPAPVLIAGWIKIAAGLLLVGLAGVASYEVLRERSTPVEIAASQPASIAAAPEALSVPAQNLGRTENAPAAVAAAVPAPNAEPLARVDARVLDSHGLPIRGARMKLTDRSAIGECTDEQAPQALSDGAGKASLSIRDADRSRRRGKRAELPRHSWDGELEFSCRGYATRSVLSTLVLGEPSSIGDVVLQDGADLSGRCLASDGTPLAKTWVQLMYPDLSLEDRALARRGHFGRSARLRSVQCAADGTFSMPGVPVGCFRVYAAEQKRSAAISEPFRLTTGEQHTVPDLVLEECAVAIRGTVLEPDGSPCAEAEIEYTFGAEGEFVGTRAEKDGSFALLGIAPIAIDIYAHHAKGESGEAVLRGVREGETGLVLRLPPPRSFDVHVDDPSGAPVERYSLGIHAEDGTGSRGTVTAPGGSISQIARARPFMVRVEVDGFAALEQGPFTQENVPARLNFRLPVSAAVRGRIVREKIPQPWLEVHLDAALEAPRIRADGLPVLGEPGTWTQSQEDGTFAIGAGRSGKYMLWVQGERGAVVFSQPIELSVGSPIEGLLVDLAAGGVLTGRVETTLETRGRALQVMYSCGVREPRSERIAPDGHFRIAGIAPGTWWLRVMPDTSNSSVLLPAGTQVEDSLLKRVEVRAGETSRCDFDARESESRRIDGRMRLGGSAAFAWTATIAPEDRWWDAHLAATPLAADGHFALRTATFGTQILSLRSAGTPSRDDGIEAHVIVPADGLHWDLSCDLGTLEIEGKAGAPIQVLADLPNGATWTTHSILEADGRATLDSLPAAKVRVSVTGSKDSPVEVDIPARGRAQVRLP